VPQQAEERSAQVWTEATFKWKVVELWTLSAEEMLAAPNVGVVPWVPLAHYEGPPEVLLQRCRDRLERAGGPLRANLLAVSQVFARLHYDKPEWLEILGGRKAMIESPLIQEIVDESWRASQVEAIVAILETRLGTVPPGILAGLQQLTDRANLVRLTRRAAVCPSLEAFDASLRQELPAPAPPSTRGKRRSRKPS
jgi:hypothetical protein